jgi:cytochrome c-type biogenesis protein CcmH
MSLSLLDLLRSSSRGVGQDPRGTAGISIVTAAAVLLAAGLGATAASAGPGDIVSSALSRPGSDDEARARLTGDTRSMTAGAPASAPTDGAPASAPPGGKLLPDVNTMIERLKARLAAKPSDITGWQMLGWSYFYTAHFKEAADAYAKAMELNPNSVELKRLYEEAKAKASGSDSSEKAALSPPPPPAFAGHSGDKHGKVADGPGVEKIAKAEAPPSGEHDSKVRSMVDGLANRLENSPRDVDGWIMLMRSRVVLGEKESAATALRKALEVFKDDTVASGRITAFAVELGLKAE